MIATEKVRAMPEPIAERVLSRIPIGRFGETEEVAALVAFLCSEAAAYLTGASIPVDGGFNLNTLGLMRPRA